MNNITYISNNNNNLFTALSGDYPGEPIPEETLTHPLFWYKGKGWTQEENR